MKKISKKSVLLIIILIAIIILIGVLVFWNKKEHDKLKEPNVTEPEIRENSYEAIISINPLVKLEFKETCRKADSEDYFSCEAPEVINYELINDDAKNIYSDLDFSSTNGILDEVLVMLCRKARDNGIVFDKIDVTSDWKSFKDYETENKLLHEYNFEINIVNREELDDKVITKFKVSFNSDGGNNISSQEVIKGNKVTIPTSPTKDGYSFVEWRLNDKAYDFNSKVEADIELKAIWKKETKPNTSENQKPNNNQNNNSSQNNKPNNENKPNENENNNPPNQEPPTPVYDFNLNDNILFSQTENVIFARPSDSCIAELKDAGYIFYNEKNGDIRIQDPIDMDNYKSLYEFSCVSYISKATANVMEKASGIKIKFYNDNSSALLAIQFAEPEYRRKYKDPFESANTPKYGVMIQNAGGVEPSQLLTEKVCQEYKLSCGRW